MIDFPSVGISHSMIILIFLGIFGLFFLGGLQIILLPWSCYEKKSIFYFGVSENVLKSVRDPDVYVEIYI